MTRRTLSPRRPQLRALLMCNGEHPSRALVHRLARKAHVIVAADGGANGARTLGITPDLIIGDLDSITPGTRKFFSSTAVIRVQRQDNTDMEKALDYILAESLAREVMIIGATGKRIDHTLGNLVVLSGYARRIRVIACGDGWHAFPVTKTEQIHASVGTTLSLIPFDDCHGLTLKGLKYLLRNASLRAGQIAVSNVVRRSPCSVSLRDGKLLAVVLEEFTPRW
jgi:thiamine pyrophosphokinase